MSEIEDKILGKEKTVPTYHPQQDYLTKKTVWFVSKEGCGKSVFNGQMVKEMMSAEAQKKACTGSKKITDKEFVFERKN